MNFLQHNPSRNLPPANLRRAPPMTYSSALKLSHSLPNISHIVMLQVHLQEPAAQYAGHANDSRNKQNEAARLRRAPAAAGAVDVERLGGVRPNAAARSLGRTPAAFSVVALAASTAVLVPVHRIAAGHHRVLQVEPVGRAGRQRYVQAGHGDPVDVVAILVEG